VKRPLEKLSTDLCEMSFSLGYFTAFFHCLFFTAFFSQNHLNVAQAYSAM